MVAKKFDLKVHIRDKKTGEVVSRNPYQLIIRNGTREFVRNGVRFHPDGSQVDPNEKPIITAVDKKETLNEALAQVQDAADKLEDQKVISNLERTKLEKEKTDFIAEKKAWEDVKNSKDVIPEVKIKEITKSKSDIKTETVIKKKVVLAQDSNSSAETNAAQSNY